MLNPITRKVATLATVMLTAASAGPAVTAADAAPSRGEYIVQVDSGTALDVAHGLVREQGGRSNADVRLIHAVVARMSAGAARRVASDPRVKAVSPNARVQSSNTRKRDGSLEPQRLETAFVQSAKAEKAWLDNTWQATGRGVGVAVIDTGIAGDLAAFRTSQADRTSRVVASVVTNPDATTPYDTYGHGTHVAGLIAGNGFARAATDPLYGKHAGTAPHANLVSIKVSDDKGDATVLDAIYGLQFAVDHKADYNIRVANLSLNSTVAESYTTDPLDAAVEAAWMQGIVVVAAAGNAGTAADAVHYAPANDPYAIVVGGADDKGTKDVADDSLASWSSRGITQDGFAKPDVIAPGAHLVSALAPNSEFSRQCPTCIVDGEFIRAGGTSMAAAVMSGVVADVISAHPEWTPDQVKEAVTGTYREVAGLGREVATDSAVKADLAVLPNANVGLTPNMLVDAATGSIDYTKATWRKATWREAGDLLSALFAKASWRCDCAAAAVVAPDQTVETARATWRKASWRMSWDK